MASLRLNVVLSNLSSEAILVRRLAVYAKRADAFLVRCSDAPLPEAETDCYALRLNDLHLLTSPDRRPATWLPVIGIGPPESLRRAFVDGCADYIKEPWSPEELHFRALKVGRRNSYRFSWGVLEHDGFILRFGFDGAGAKRTTTVRINRKQSALLGALLALRGEVVSRELLFFAMWGRDGGGSRAVDMQIHALRAGVDTAARGLGAELIKSVYGNGYTIE